jgi:hypothetical protein
MGETITFGWVVFNGSQVNPFGFLLGLTLVGCSFAGCDRGREAAPGQVECYRDTECTDRANYLVDATLNAPAPWVLSESRCVALAPLTEEGNSVGTSNGTVCECSTPQGDGYMVGLDSAGCVVHGRARQCLYLGATFKGCVPDDPGSCSAVCKEISDLTKQDFERPIFASVRATRCIRYACAVILTIDDKCYINRNTLALDCSLSDDEILNRDLSTFRY